jgi:Ca2+-binding RTX toxin-like protein
VIWASDTDALIDGGDGNDTVVFTAPVSDSNLGDLDLVDVEYIVIDAPPGIYSFASQTENLTIIGGTTNDTILGGSGDDSIVGGLGDDWLQGGDMDDDLQGGEGSDTVDYGYTTSGVTVSLAESGFTAVTVAVLHDIDRLAEIENVVGGSGNDVLSGNTLANVLSAGIGDDQLNGGGGDDTLRGGAGNDVFDGGEGLDTVDFSYATTNLIFFLGGPGTVATVTVATGDVDEISNVENVIGGDGNDFIYGFSGRNVLNGGAGNDSLDGLGGNDTLIGGAGDDRLYGASGNDSILLDGGDGNDTADFSVLDNPSGSVILTLGLVGDGFLAGGALSGEVFGIENIVGSGGNDNLTGNDGTNTLLGGEGDDFLSGGSFSAYVDFLAGDAGDDVLNLQGAATLIGGEGADTFFGGVRDSYAMDGVQAVPSDMPNILDLGVDDLLQLHFEGVSGTFSAFLTVNEGSGPGSAAFDGTNAVGAPSSGAYFAIGQGVLYFDEDASTEGFSIIARVGGASTDVQQAVFQVVNPPA